MVVVFVVGEECEWVGEVDRGVFLSFDLILLRGVFPGFLCFLNWCGLYHES